MATHGHTSSGTHCEATKAWTRWAASHAKSTEGRFGKQAGNGSHAVRRSTPHRLPLQSGRRHSEARIACLNPVYRRCLRQGADLASDWMKTFGGGESRKTTAVMPGGTSPPLQGLPEKKRSNPQGHEATASTTPDVHAPSQGLGRRQASLAISPAKGRPVRRSTPKPPQDRHSVERGQTASDEARPVMP